MQVQQQHYRNAAVSLNRMQQSQQQPIQLKPNNSDYMLQHQQDQWNSFQYPSYPHKPAVIEAPGFPSAHSMKLKTSFAAPIAHSASNQIRIPTDHSRSKADSIESRWNTNPQNQIIQQQQQQQQHHERQNISTNLSYIPMNGVAQSVQQQSESQTQQGMRTSLNKNGHSPKYQVPRGPLLQIIIEQQQKQSLNPPTNNNVSMPTQNKVVGSTQDSFRITKSPKFQSVSPFPSQKEPSQRKTKEHNSSSHQPSSSSSSSQHPIIHQEAPTAPKFDYRKEVQRRFEKSITNTRYVFPRIQKQQKEQNGDQFSLDSSRDSSIESMQNITLYDLRSQNTKKNVSPHSVQQKSTTVDSRRLLRNTGSEHSSIQPNKDIHFASVQRNLTVESPKSAFRKADNAQSIIRTEGDEALVASLSQPRQVGIIKQLNPRSLSSHVKTYQPPPSTHLLQQYIQTGSKDHFTSPPPLKMAFQNTTGILQLVNPSNGSSMAPITSNLQQTNNRLSKSIEQKTNTSILIDLLSKGKHNIDYQATLSPKAELAKQKVLTEASPPRQANILNDYLINLSLFDANGSTNRIPQKNFNSQKPNTSRSTSSAGNTINASSLTKRQPSLQTSLSRKNQIKTDQLQKVYSSNSKRMQQPGDSMEFLQNIISQSGRVMTEGAESGQIGERLSSVKNLIAPKQMKSSSTNPQINGGGVITMSQNYQTQHGQNIIQTYQQQGNILSHGSIQSKMQNHITMGYPQYLKSSLIPVKPIYPNTSGANSSYQNKNIISINHQRSDKIRNSGSIERGFENARF